MDTKQLISPEIHKETKIELKSSTDFCKYHFLAIKSSNVKLPDLYIFLYSSSKHCNLFSLVRVRMLFRWCGINMFPKTVVPRKLQQSRPKKCKRDRLPFWKSLSLSALRAVADVSITQFFNQPSRIADTVGSTLFCGAWRVYFQGCCIQYREKPLKFSPSTSDW